MNTTLPQTSFTFTQEGNVGSGFNVSSISEYHISKNDTDPCEQNKAFTVRLYAWTWTRSINMTEVLKYTLK